jgi:hypothetical protein
METEELKQEINMELIKKPLKTPHHRINPITNLKLFLRILFTRHSRIFSVSLLVFRLIGIITVLVIFEIAFFILLSKIGSEFYEIWILQAFIINSCLLFIYSTLQLGRSPIFRIFKVISSLIMLIILSGLFILVSIYFDALINLKIILGVSAAYYLVNTYLLVRYTKIKSHQIKLKAAIMVLLIYFSFSGIIFFVSLTPRSIEIKPKTEPELIFWCGSSQLPDDPDILEMCKKYNIAFMPTIRESNVGNEEYMNAYKNLIAHEINLYFAIGGNSDFFAHLDNAKEFPSIYKNISQWFITEGIMNSPYVTSFSIDAEPPDEYTDALHNNDFLNTFNYGYKNYPSQKEIADATDSLREFAELIKDDGKKCGMIQGYRFLDNADQDGDMSLFMRNIYSLPIKWDFTITMLYRTNRLQYDETDDDPPEFIVKAFSIFYDAVIEGTKFTTSELSFYQNVAFEENSEDDLAKEHYIFIGNFKREFKDTTYIKDKQFFMDLDICRHFKNEKVFFYDLKGFLSHYDWEGIEELGKHILKKDKSYLEYSTFKSVTFLTFYCGLITIDIVASLEKNLT